MKHEFMNPPLTPVEMERQRAVMLSGQLGTLVLLARGGRGEVTVLWRVTMKRCCCSVLVEFLKGINSPGYTEQEGRGRWQDRGEHSFSGRGAVACSACSLLLAAGGCVILQLIFSIKSIESVPDSVCPHPWPVAGIFTTIYLSIQCTSYIY